MVTPKTRELFGHYMAGRAGNFQSRLFEAFFAADRQNFAKLRGAFPEEAEVVAEYRGFPVPNEAKK